MINIPQGKTILVAEDDNISYNLLKEIIVGHNLNIIRAENGSEAIEFIKENQNIDLILMDIKMPKVDGLTATKTIRKNNKKIPIIAQSAFAYSSDKDEAFRAGCTDYMAKPISGEELLLLITKYIGQ